MMVTVNRDPEFLRGVACAVVEQNHPSYDRDGFYLADVVEGVLWWSDWEIPEDRRPFVVPCSKLLPPGRYTDYLSLDDWEELLADNKYTFDDIIADYREHLDETADYEDEYQGSFSEKYDAFEWAWDSEKYGMYLDDLQDAYMEQCIAYAQEKIYDSIESPE